jgi:iron complex outermembrane receptor protein
MKTVIATAPAGARGLLALTFAVAVMSVPATPTWADEDSLSEVVVTAQRRTESLQDVPISIGTLNGQQLADFGAQGFETFANRIPGLQVFNAGNDNVQLQMRGIVTSIDQDQSPQTNTTVGLYLDDLSTGLSSANPNFVLEDLERVEVLRGPQGTLYGAGSESGTIRLITRKPELDTWEAQISGEGAGVSGGTADWHGSAVVNAPLVDGVAAIRVLTYYRKDGGYLDNPVLGLTDTNTQFTYGGRTEILVKPTQDLTFLLSATLQDQREADNDFYNAYYGFPIRTTYALEPQEGDSRVVSFNADWALPGMTLTSVSGYQSKYQNAVLEAGKFPVFAGAPPGIYNSAIIPTINHVYAESQEFRLASADAAWGNWLAGTYFSNQVRKTTQNLDAPGIEALVSGLPSGPSQGTTTDSLYEGYQSLNTKQYAVFGDGTWKITPALLLSGGLRWFHYDQESRYRAAGVLNGGLLLGNAGIEQSGTNPRVNLAYHLDPDDMVYVTASRGFRLGGVNDPIPLVACGLNAQPPGFKSDSLWNYEVGAKSSWDDRKVTLDGAVFFIDFKNFQTQYTLNPCGSALIQNAGTLLSRGLELELTARPIAPLQLSFGATYTDSTLKDDVAEVGLAGDRAPYVPRLALDVGAGFSQPLTSGIAGFAGVDAQYVGSRVTAFSEQPTYFGTYLGTLPAYTVVGAHFGIETGRVRAALFGANLGDKHPLLYQNALMQSTIAQLQTTTLYPRTVGLRFTYKIR